MSHQPRRVVVATTGRADYGLLRPVLRALQLQPRVKTRLLVTGAHLSRRLGFTVREIEADGFGSIVVRVPLPNTSDDAAGMATWMGAGLLRFADVFDRSRPDVLVVLGDRYETLAVAAAAVPFNIILAHVHGGERTEGAADESIRHALTKLSHLHFVSSARHAARVKQMGEEAWRVTVSGAPGLDEIRAFRPTPARELADELGVRVDRQTLLVTYHPETLQADGGRANLNALLRALDRIGAPVVFTAPNADIGHDAFRAAIESASKRQDRVMVENLGHQKYFSLMSYVGAMVGNSSSGIIEAPSFHLPVVNIGLRQQGREHARNVITVRHADRIESAIRRAIRPAFRRTLAGLRNPYGHGNASGRIARRLATVPLDGRLLVKQFVDR
jgi:UDP-hydrolysing UDP-N-acetyl-D-glucosamine 2-epimerase